jgi:deazaflavin-dependent oxidoreductase (nitroreductase family)
MGTPLRLFWAWHRWIFLTSRGRLGAKLGKQRFLALTTVGRMSGEARTHLLTYVEEGGCYFVVASNAGEPNHPAWWLNLQAKPEAEVMIRGQTTTIIAKEVDGDLRHQIWERFVAIDDAYAVYATRTERRIPVVGLQPKN